MVTRGEEGMARAMFLRKRSCGIQRFGSGALGVFTSARGVHLRFWRTFNYRGVLARNGTFFCSFVYVLVCAALHKTNTVFSGSSGGWWETRFCCQLSWRGTLLVFHENGNLKDFWRSYKAFEASRCKRSWGGPTISCLRRPTDHVAVCNYLKKCLLFVLILKRHNRKLATSTFLGRERRRA